jgi:hypothetical protein
MDSVCSAWLKTAYRPSRSPFLTATNYLHAMYMECVPSSETIENKSSKSSLIFYNSLQDGYAADSGFSTVLYGKTIN